MASSETLAAEQPIKKLKSLFTQIVPQLAIVPKLAADDQPVRIKHAAFLSHHKSHAGEAARIFVDTAKRLLETSACERIRNSDLVKGLPSEDIIFLDSTGLKARRHCCHCYCDYYCGAYGGCLCCNAEGAPCTARQAGVHASRHPEYPVLIAPIAAAHAPVSDTRLAPSRRICPSSSKTWNPPPTTS